MYISPDVFLGYIYGTTDTTTLAYYLKLKKSFHSTSFHFRYFDVILQNPVGCHDIAEILLELVLINKQAIF